MLVWFMVSATPCACDGPRRAADHAVGGHVGGHGSRIANLADCAIDLAIGEASRRNPGRRPITLP